MKKIMSLALLTLLVLGLSTARAENCINVAMSCSRGLLLTAEDRQEANETGERSWSAMVCGDSAQQLEQKNFWNKINC